MKKFFSVLSLALIVFQSVSISISYSVFAQAGEEKPERCNQLTLEDCLSLSGTWHNYVGDGNSGGENNCSPVGASSNEGTGYTGTFPIRVPKINDAAKLAAAIDAYIADKNPGSPLNGLGKYFVDGGMRAGINPLLAVAHARKESTFGTAGIATRGTNNAFGRTATSSQPHYQGSDRKWYKWESWQKSLYADSFPASGSSEQPDDWFQYVARVYANELDDLDAFVNRYAPAFENNTEKYIQDVLVYANDVVALADGAIDMTQLGSISTGGGSSCACTTPGSTLLPDESSHEQNGIFTKKTPVPFSGSPITPTGIVLHWTAGSAQQSVDSFISGISGRGLSVQLFIDGGGTVWQLVDQLNTKTAHDGASGSNQKTIGIEIAGMGEDDLLNNQAQKNAVIQTVKELQAMFNIPSTTDVPNKVGILSHHLTSPERKIDVGDTYHAQIVAAVGGDPSKIVSSSGGVCADTDTGGGDPSSNKVLGEKMAAENGFSGAEWVCLEELWTRESSWNHTANNPTSSAYGIPQALIGAHKENIDTNYSDYYEREIQGTPGNPATYDYEGGSPTTQIKWGLDYIKGRYSTPCRALEFHDANNHY